MIYGERIRLRAIERGDLPSFVDWLNDPQVRRYLLMNIPLSLAMEERWFESMMNREPAEIPMAVEAKVDDSWKLIGNTTFFHIDWVNRHTEIGILIGDKTMWNHGYGTETMRLMLKHGFETLNLNRIFLRVYEDNIGGIKAYERAGFIHEGRQRQAVYSQGRYCDLLVMSVLREEYFQTISGHKALNL